MKRDSLMIVLIIVIGMVFVYASIKGTNPKDLLKRALKGGK